MLVHTALLPTLNHVLSYWYTGVCLHICTVQFQDARAYVRGQSNYCIGFVQHIIIVIGSLPKNRAKNYVWIIMAYIELYATGSKLSITLKSKDLATCGFQKDSQHTHQNPLKPSPVSERSAYPLHDCICFCPHSKNQIVVLANNLVTVFA